MVCNVGNVDRVVRVLAGIVLVGGTLIFVSTPLPKIILLTIAVLLLMSSWFGVCYLYKLFGMSTARVPMKQAEHS